jgi:hypothetical protein
MYSDLIFDFTSEESELKKALPSYRNIMEELVDFEVERQMKKLPSVVQDYLDPVEIATYALNRLPPLYASSEKGKIEQEKFAKHQLREKITETVLQAIATIREDPIRHAIPLIKEIDLEYQEAYSALEKVQHYLEEINLLYYAVLTWENLLDAVKYAVENISYLEITKIHKQELVNRFRKWSERNHK